MDILNKSDLKNYIEKEISFSIDRFEEDFAVCENRATHEMVNISRKLLPLSAKPGDILILKNFELILDSEKTKEEQKEIKNLVDNLFKKK